MNWEYAILTVLVVLVVLVTLSYWPGSEEAGIQPKQESRRNRKIGLRRPRPIETLQRNPFPDSATLRSERTSPTDLDERLRKKLAARNITPLEKPEEHSKALLRLGRWLFWEKELSGNRRISCAVCHNPTLATTDKLSLSIGTEAEGDSIFRRPGPNTDFVPRNALPLFNLAQDEMDKLLWDNRIALKSDGTFKTPAGDTLTGNFTSLHEVQSIFPLVTNEEFRGEEGNRDIFGHTNELANIPDGAFREIWSRILDRLLDYKTYRQQFLKAFPIEGTDQITIEHVGKALGAFEEAAFTLRDSPWDRYLRGYNGSLTTRQKKGALLFYGKANCSECHSGTMMSDLKPHNIAVPQLGPGKPPHEPYDMGAYRITGDTEDKFAFRTPPLRNVSLTGPWMHNGAYKSLEGAVRHHLNPIQSLKNYNAEQLARNIQLYHRSPNWTDQLKQFPRNSEESRLIGSVRDNPEDYERITATLDPLMKNPSRLNNREIDQIMWFLFSLTSPTLVMDRFKNQNGKDANLTQPFRKRTGHLTEYMHSTVANTTPSGIPIECRAEWCRETPQTSEKNE